MDPFLIYGVVMVILLAVNVVVTYLLTKGVADSHRLVPALNERAFTAVTKTIAVSLLTLLSANRAFDFHWPPEFTVGLLVIATLITSASPIGWLWLYVTNKFGDGPNDIVLFGGIKDKDR